MRFFLGDDLFDQVFGIALGLVVKLFVERHTVELEFVSNFKGFLGGFQA